MTQLIDENILVEEVVKHLTQLVRTFPDDHSLFTRKQPVSARDLQRLLSAEGVQTFQPALFRRVCSKLEPFGEEACVDCVRWAGLSQTSIVSQHPSTVVNDRGNLKSVLMLPTTLQPRLLLSQDMSDSPPVPSIKGMSSVANARPHGWTVDHDLPKFVSEDQQRQAEAETKGLVLDPDKAGVELMRSLVALGQQKDRDVGGALLLRDAEGKGELPLQAVLEVLVEVGATAKELQLLRRAVLDPNGGTQKVVPWAFWLGKSLNSRPEDNDFEYTYGMIEPEDLEFGSDKPTPAQVNRSVALKALPALSTPRDEPRGVPSWEIAASSLSHKNPSVNASHASVDRDVKEASVSSLAIDAEIAGTSKELAEETASHDVALATDRSAEEIQPGEQNDSAVPASGQALSDSFQGSPLQEWMVDGSPSSATEVMVPSAGQTLSDSFKDSPLRQFMADKSPSETMKTGAGFQTSLNPPDDESQEAKPQAASAENQTEGPTVEKPLGESDKGQGAQTNVSPTSVNAADAKAAGDLSADDKAKKEALADAKVKEDAVADGQAKKDPVEGAKAKDLVGDRQAKEDTEETKATLSDAKAKKATVADANSKKDFNDANAKKPLSLQEVEQVLEHTRGVLGSWIGSSPQEAFQKVCRTGYEGIDRIRFYALLYRCKPGLGEQELEVLWRHCDADCDNMIDFVEFERFLSPA
eukprot:gnl/MRDRNA2_/MRDRNA2_52215_c0_seq1.p1 gnl/MRDRNA2_/MRDRNA2_52215_c0~~gnl/MRDRNA2_/MRDRNA2_52215_c0_seq1.p1  ORF type:complete len:697 (+),score=137.81 gnl/MRDRNA2_/MRDRNA2_52215_c0_seq1:169-2259(+)